MTRLDPSKRIQRIERLLEITRSLGATLELESLLTTLVNGACELTNSEKSAVLLYEDETDLLKYVAGTTNDKDDLRRHRIPLEKTVAGSVYSYRKPVIIHNAHSDPRIVREIEKAFGVEIRTILAVPMVFRGEAIGVVQVMNRCDKAHYTEDDVTILETLTAQASSSILSTLMLEETKRAYEELEQLEKMKSDFIAIASHELRTPLGLIVGHSADLHDQIKNKEQQHQLDVIMRSATRLKKLIDDLSNVNSFQSGHTRVHQKSVNISSLVNEIVSHFQEAARIKRIQLRSQLPRKEITVSGDEEKLALVLSNLVENALNFTDMPGQVLVSLETLPGYIKVSVIDTGIGIPSKDLSRVFDRFYQVESHLTRRHAGMGLGLSVAKAMVEMHDGQIWVESIEGKGSNFSFLLPVKSEREKTKPTGIQTSALSKPFE